MSCCCAHTHCHEYIPTYPSAYVPAEYPPADYPPPRQRGRRRTVEKVDDHVAELERELAQLRQELAQQRGQGAGAE